MIVLILTGLECFIKRSEWGGKDGADTELIKGDVTFKMLHHSIVYFSPEMICDANYFVPFN